MDLLSIVGFAAISYCLVYILFLFLLDCDLGLAWAAKFGKGVESVRGKVIWITGASSGIGEGIAVALAKGGARIVISARRKGELERVKMRCIEEGKAKEDDVYVLPMDVTLLDNHKNCLDSVIKEFGRLDILVNNAGRSQRAEWEEIEASVDQEMFNLNVFSVVSLTRVVVRYFLNREERGGHIAVTSSIAGLIGVPYSASYTGAKHALHGYFNSLRAEKVADSLTVTILCPGPVYTNFLSESFTGKSGVKYGIPANANDRRLTSDRCGYLCAVALANSLREAWMALPPVLPMAYMGCYLPNAAWKIGEFLGAKYMLKLRDSKTSLKNK